MRSYYFLIIIYSILIALFTGCEKDSTGSKPNTGTLKIFLADSPAMYDSVNITFSEISAHLDSEWVRVQGQPKTVNLLDYANGNALLLSSANVPAGKYTQIRLIIDSATVWVDSQSHPLVVPSGAQTGLKFGPQFTISEGLSYELLIDFDAQRSIVTTGPPNNPTGYKLKPHIRVTSRAVTGSISGLVTNPDDVPVAYAISGADTVNTALVNQADSTFVLAFLPEGFYQVSITDTMGLSFTQENVQVTAGENNNLGSVTLQ